MHGHRIGYVWVSSFDPNPERQLEHVPVDQVLYRQCFDPHFQFDSDLSTFRRPSASLFIGARAR